MPSASAPTTATEERARALLFSEGYLNTDYTFVIGKNGKEIKGLDDLKGRSIAVAKGSTLDIWLTDNAPGAKLVRFEDTPSAVAAYLAGQSESFAENSAIALKVAEDNLDTTSATWGVDHMISGGGWHHFTMPSCIADGQYLLRIELLALHSAPSEPQFYASCAQIQVTGGGAFSPSQTQKIPGSYDRMDPSINAMIYDGNGQPTNSYQPYQAPGMRPITC